MGSLDPHSPSGEADEHRVELGRYLRARRGQIRPEDFGIARARHRRVQGLRRAEVAQLAAVSPTWYTWLEQGRDIRASAEVLDAVCRVLRLDEHASRYVRQLAGKPVQEPSAVNAVVDPAFDSLIADLLPAPACGVTESYDILSWNVAFAKVIGDPSIVRPDQRNIVRMCFDDPSFRQRVSSWSTIAGSAVAELRAASARNPHCVRLRQLIDDLKASNHDFRLAWDALNVRPFFGEVTTIEVGGVGSITVKVMELVLRDESMAIIFLFQPVDAESRALLAQLVDAGDGASE